MGQRVVVTGVGVEMGMGGDVEQRGLITFLGTLQDALTKTYWPSSCFCWINENVWLIELSREGVGWEGGGGGGIIQNVLIV